MAGTLLCLLFSVIGPILNPPLPMPANEGPWPLTVWSRRVWIGAGVAICLVRHVSKLAAFLPKSGGWMTELKVVIFWLC